jgi:superfamily II DNA or RNA helicase
MRVCRPYQEDAYAATLRELERVTSTILVLPTGTGKTVILAKLVANWNRGNVLLLAHRTELLEQARDKFGAELGYLPVIEQAERGMEPDCLWRGGLVLVASVQTMRNDKRLEKFRNHPFDLIAIDEAHHAVAKSYRKIVDYFLAMNPSCKVVGVTATPTRSDETAMGTVFTSCAYQYPICQAIDDGWLTRPRQFLVTVEGVDFSGVRMTRNEFGETDFNQADLEAVLVEEEPLHGLAKPILEQAGGRSGIIFAAGVGHAHLLAAVLNRERQGCAAAVDGTTDKEKRRQLVKDFSEGRLQFLSNFNVFSEGFDCPQASLVVMGRPTKSLLVYTQQLGRVLRPLDGLVDGFADAADRRAAILSSEKPYALCLDFVGNSRHRIVTCADVLGGNYDLAAIDRARRNIAEGQKPTRPADVIEELKKARAELLLEAEQESRRLVRAQVSYSAHEVNALVGGDVAGRGVERTRGGSSDSQIAFLVNLGVSRQTASGYTRRQASAVIEKLKAQRCTNKQRAILTRFGEPADVNFDEAKTIIDEIASAGWQPRGKYGTEERA